MITREEYLNAVRSGKSFVSKSAAPPIPIFGRQGFVGYGTEPELVSGSEVALMIAAERTPIQKSAVPAFDLNECLAGFIPDLIAAPPREVVQKSAPNPNDPNECLTSLFPFPREELQKAVSGGELMNRVSGRNAADSEAKKQPGRPRVTGEKTPLDSFDPSWPCTTIAIDEAGQAVKAGSVLEVLMPDGSTAFVVLFEDARCGVLGTSEG